jgi:hypothetical protein
MIPDTAERQRRRPENCFGSPETMAIVSPVLVSFSIFSLLQHKKKDKKIIFCYD